MTPIKVIFLDIDGVLCTSRAHMVYGKEGSMWFEWDPLGCQAISNACSMGVRLVISSTWRYPRHEAHLFSQLEKYDLKKHLLEDWRTIDLAVSGEWNDANCRGGEIKEYLSRHPEVGSYRILDDIPQFLPEQMPYFIQTDPDDGMESGSILALLRWARYLKS